MGSNPAEQLLTTNEVATMLRVTPRRALQLPIKRVRMGHRTVRFRLQDVYEFLGVPTPALSAERGDHGSSDTG